MTTYLLHQAGREPSAIEATSIRDAKAQLRYMAKQEQIRCRSRYGKGNGYKHRVNSFTYLVTIGRDASSSLWTSLSLQVVK